MVNGEEGVDADAIINDHLMEDLFAGILSN